MDHSDSGKVITCIDPKKEEGKCLFAVPKKGRIYEKCMEMVLGAGLEHHRPNRLDVAHCTNLDVTIVFLPAADIASYVAEGNVDIGMTGLDCLEEANANVEKIMVILCSYNRFVSFVSTDEYAILI